MCSKNLIISLLAFLIGINLRPIMASISPLVEMLQHAMPINNTEMSLLTTFPVVMMGICTLAGPYLRSIVGESKGISIGLMAILLTNVIRLFLYSPYALISTAILGGMGIAFIQALMPSYLKRLYPQHAGTLMGLFTTGIMAGAALSASISVPLAHQAGLNVALGIAILPALISLIIWMSFNKNQTANTGLTISLPFNNQRAWLLLIFFGIGTAAYTLVLAWLPPYYMELGWTAKTSGYLLGGLTLMEVIAGFIVSSIIGKTHDYRKLLMVSLCLLLLGLICLIVSPVDLAMLAMTLLGLGIGALFPLSLIVTLNHAQNSSDAVSLLAFVQGGGYLIAAAMPFIAGILRDKVSSLQSAWGIMIIGTLLLLVISLKLKPKNR